MAPHAKATESQVTARPRFIGDSRCLTQIWKNFLVALEAIQIPWVIFIVPDGAEFL